MTPADRDWLDVLVGITSAVNALVLLAILIALVPALLSLARTARELRQWLDRAYDDFRPVATHARRIAANLDDISESVRTEVKDVQHTIALANRGLSHAVESTEKRIQQFGALVDVAQREAERAFVSTAAAVHGVRAGAREAVRRPRAVDGAAPDEPKRPRVRSGRKRRD